MAMPERVLPLSWLSFSRKFSFYKSTYSCFEWEISSIFLPCFKVKERLWMFLWNSEMTVFLCFFFTDSYSFVMDQVTKCVHLCRKLIFVYFHQRWYMLILFLAGWWCVQCECIVWWRSWWWRWWCVIASRFLCTDSCLHIKASKVFHCLKGQMVSVNLHSRAGT